MVSPGAAVGRDGAGRGPPPTETVDNERFAGIAGRLADPVLDPPNE